MKRNPTIEDMRKALQASFDSMTPHEHFERMIRNGIINRKGEVTTLIGGDAAPEPGACRPEDRPAAPICD